jgi:heterodisulfide reductase subunit C
MLAGGETEAVLESGVFVYCSSCYHCTLRCPRGLPLTEAMAALKQASARANPWAFKATQRFYHRFMASVRRHGRVKEAEFMTWYFWDMKNPFLPLSYLPLGFRLMVKGKVRPEPPSFGGPDALGPLFDRVRALEERS